MTRLELGAPSAAKGISYVRLHTGGKSAKILMSGISSDYFFFVVF